MEVNSRGRLYTSKEQRRRLGIVSEYVGEYGQGTDVEVGIMTVDRSRDWGSYSELATFTATLGSYGEVRIPNAVQDALAIREGDSVRVTFVVPDVFESDTAVAVEA